MVSNGINSLSRWIPALGGHGKSHPVTSSFRLFIAAETNLENRRWQAIEISMVEATDGFASVWVNAHGFKD